MIIFIIVRKPDNSKTKVLYNKILVKNSKNTEGYKTTAISALAFGTGE
jgi:hypothetical protein